MSIPFFQLLKKDPQTKARLGKITTAHGTIDTPFFMPVGTNSSVKSLTFEDLREFDTSIILSNTYHLYLRPGMEIMQAAGGLHGFTGWSGPILTDSGGYQVFSLTKLRKLSDEGVKFRSHLDGSLHFFTPETVVDIQMILGSDIMMPLDVCAPYPCKRKEAEKSVEKTTRWARQSKIHFEKHRRDDRPQRLFGIIQGATYKDLRERSAHEILGIDLDGYAVGGVSVGEPVEEMFAALTCVIPFLPENRPRYFMGIGLPDQMVKAVGEGIDMFDTCLPTRFGRHGTAFTRRGRLIIRNGSFAKDFAPIDPACRCIVCQRYSRAYIRHLTNLHEMTGLRLVSYHNVYFYVNLMREMRQAIAEDRYADFQREFLTTYGSPLA